MQGAACLKSNLCKRHWLTGKNCLMPCELECKPQNGGLTTQHTLCTFYACLLNFVWIRHELVTLPENERVHKFASAMLSPCQLPILRLS